MLICIAIIKRNEVEIVFVSYLLSTAYLIGSIPTGYCIAQLKGFGDIRHHGSGNIGATNVGRYLGLPFFFITFFIDASKAYGVLYWVSLHTGATSILYVSALTLLLGNACSLFLRCSGGKGVSTSIGIIAYLYPSLALLFVLLWFFYFICFRDAGIASVLSIWSSTVCAWLMSYCYAWPDFRVFVLLISTMASGVTWLHKSNLGSYFSSSKKSKRRRC